MQLKNLVIAHRGLHDNIKVPENSLLSFKKALNKNYPIELDIQLTKDNVLVVFHDKNLKRMTNCNKNISDITYDELRKLNLLNTKEKIPTFKEVLDVINGKVLLDIEIKDTDKVNQICQILCNHLDNYNYEYIIKSFNPKIVRWFYKNKPNIIRGLLIKKKINKLLIIYCKPNFLAFSKEVIDKYKINKYQKKYPILIWTILDKKEMNKYNNITNNYICNNLL